MKWVVLAGFIVYLATYSAGCALKNIQEAKNGNRKNGTIKDVTETLYSKVRRQNDTREIVCLAGSTWESSCQSCRCLESGLPDCVKQDDCKNDDIGGPMICKPLTQFSRDCNTCTCLSNGLDIDCTQMECSDEEVLPDGIDCQVGSSWRSKCNECTCEKGLPVCTDKACPEEKGSELSCKPGTVWQLDCNTCYCLPTGRAICTRLGCDSVEASDFNPERNNGTPEIVFRTAPIEKTIVCAANRMFIKDCNQCWCNEDGTSYYCTRLVCGADVIEDTQNKPENPQETKRKCRPDEVFQSECNMCRCAADGMSYSCTRRACVPQDDGKNLSLTRKVRATSQGTLKACQPGQEFRMDCNMCLCNNEGQDYSCTRIDCSAINSNGNSGARTKRDVATQVKTDCEPGSVFKQGCNTCRCTEDGNHATCTIKRCKQDNPDENDINLSESDPSFRCNPGEQFKRGCNDCTCSADGKSVFCTLRLCDQDITPTI